MRLQPLQVSDAGIREFVVAIAANDGAPPLSEHKLRRIGGSDDAEVAAWSHGGRLVAVSVAAFHEGDTPHWAIEVAVSPTGRSAALEEAAIVAAELTVPDDAPSALWSHRAGQTAAAVVLGYVEQRSVLRMEGPFPDSREPAGLELGTIEATDDADLIAVHNLAFAGHREASGMTQARLDELRSMPWYDPDGVVTGWIDGRLAGFCWTKLHPDGAGEVYFLAVDPAERGRGIGEVLAAAGFAHLRRRGAGTAMLWVDGHNEGAIALYRRLGLQTTFTNVELVKAAG